MKWRALYYTKRRKTAVSSQTPKSSPTMNNTIVNWAALANNATAVELLTSKRFATITDFEDMIAFAQQGRASGNWDGLKMWTDAKVKFSDEAAGNWTGPILNESYSKTRERILRELPEHDADGKMNEPNHFIIQCLRIPFKNEFTERRLMQVAYNIGQFKADASMYNQTYIDEFYALKLDKIATYVN